MLQASWWRPVPTYNGQFGQRVPSPSVHPQETDPQEHAPSLPSDSRPGPSVLESLEADGSDCGPTFRHSGWARSRERVATALNLAETPAGRQQAFRSCGHRAYVLQSLTDPERFKLTSSKCKDRFCKPCARERAGGVARTLLEHVDGRELRFCTLTLATRTPDLKAELDRLYKAFQQLRRRKFWKRHVIGGAAMLEVKWNEKSSRWHPHLHILMEGRYTPHAQLVKEWRHVTGDSFIVDIRAVRDNEKVTRYITKYATDPIDSSIGRDVGRLTEAIVAFKGRKTCLTFGTWRQVVLTDPADTDGWRHLMTLDRLITLARDGYGEYRTILARIWTFSESDEKHAQLPDGRDPDSSQEPTLPYPQAPFEQ